jgi:hypothetical protein
MLSYVHASSYPLVSAKEIAINNLIITDKLRDLALFSGACLGVHNANPELDFLGLEKLLRENECNAYIFPRPIQRMPEGFELFNKYSDERCRYELIYSTRMNNGGLAELLEIWPSYEESCANLKYAGQFKAISSPPPIPVAPIDGDDVYVFEPSTAGFVNALSNNKIIMSINLQPMSNSS